LTLAVEERSGGTSLYEQPQSTNWCTSCCATWCAPPGAAATAKLLAHLLLAAVRADLLNHLASRRGISRRRLRAALASAVDLVLEAADASPPSD